MKYSVVQCVNGNYTIVSEGHDESAAKKAFWNRCVLLENDPSTITGHVAILTEELYVYAGYNQQFSHPAPEPEDPQGE